MKMYLNVPYREKDQAKKLGAKWDPQTKKWYIDEDASLEEFQSWLPAYLYIVIGKQQCWLCKKETRVVSFGVPYIFDVVWSLALLPRLECIPYEIRKYILDQGINYKKKFSKTTGLYQLNNCCEHCDSLQGEFFLFNEPDSPFLPNTFEEMQELAFYRVKLPAPVTGSISFWELTGTELFPYAEANHEKIDLDIVEIIRA